jgi:Ca-activated chloride channel homolog
MKRAAIVLLSLITLIIVSCKHEEPPSGSGGLAAVKPPSVLERIKAAARRDAKEPAPVPMPVAPPPPMSTGGNLYAQSGVAGGYAGGVVGGVAGGVMGGVVGGEVPPQPSYAKIVEHDFFDTKTAALTTFSIDVDRASYANVRRFLNHNQAPPPDAVRIEEMVNYFTYALPQPAGNDPFSITSEVSTCPWNNKHRLMRVALQGRNLEEWKMAPNNLVFLLDVSGSMQPPERLPLIKSAFRLLVNRLRPQDTVAIVVYAGAAGVVLPPTSGADKATILQALDRLSAGGSTAGAEGIELAYKMAEESFHGDGNNRVILATDGDFNVGVSSVEELQKLIEEKRKHNIFLTTIGVGDDNYRDDMLEMLADKGNGNYAYLDSMKEAEKVFKSELTGTLVTIAKDVKVQIEFDPARVESYRQIGYENRALENKDFEDDTKDAGELGAGHSVTALYEIVPASTANGQIATVRLRYKEPHGDTSKLITSAVNDAGASEYTASGDMKFAAAVAELGMLLRNSPHKGTATFADVASLVRGARGSDIDGYREELLRMVDTSNALVANKQIASE